MNEVRVRVGSGCGVPITVDSELSLTSVNPVQNKVITAELENKAAAADLAAVATSGAYSDLSGTPNLAAVATSGAYSDLSGTPSLAAVATSGAYSDLSGTPSLAAVATSGSYTDLSDKPSIPAAVTVDDALSVSSENPVQNKVITAALAGVSSWITSVPEMHRNIFRGQSLGSTVTAAQLAAIADGSFDDLYVGDYWTIPTTIGGVTTSIKYRIADIDYLLGTGEYPDHILDKHHLVIVPDTALDTAVMGSNNYWTSTLRTTNIAAIKTALDAIFPNMILPFYLQPTVTDPTYLQCYVEVMSAYMVYGHQGLYIDDDRSPIDKTQLALFALAPKAITVPDTSYWLNTRLSDTTRMQAVTKAGEMWRGTVASSQYGIRPFFLLGDAT